MAIVPRVSMTSLAPPGGNRFVAAGPVAPVNPTPLEALSQYSAVSNDAASFRYEDFTARQRFQAQMARNAATRTERSDQRAGGLFGKLVGSTAEFAEAFSVQPQTGRRGAEARPSAAAMKHGIGVYEGNARIIAGEAPTLGESVSLTS